MTEAHTTESLLLAALTADEDQDPAVVEALTEAGRGAKGAAQHKASAAEHARARGGPPRGAGGGRGGARGRGRRGKKGPRRRPRQGSGGGARAPEGRERAA